MEQDNIYKDILDSISDGIYFVDMNKKITYWNRGAERLSGYKAYEILGSSCSDGILVHVDEQGNNLCDSGCPLHETLEDGKERMGELYIHHREGHRLPVEISVTPFSSPDGKMIGAIEVFRDNSAHMQDKDSIKQLEKASLLDPLTSLGNRRLIEMKLEASFEQLARHNILFGILMIEIDHFSNISEVFGHSVGEDVLTMVAKTLDHNMRTSDILGRWDGEAFLAVLQHVDRKTFLTLAEKLRMLVEAAFIDRDGKRINVTVTIGAAFVAVGDSIEEIVKRADGLLLKGKADGMNRVVS